MEQFLREHKCFAREYKHIEVYLAFVVFFSIITTPLALYKRHSKLWSPLHKILNFYKNIFYVVSYFYILLHKIMYSNALSGKMVHKLSWVVPFQFLYFFFFSLRVCIKTHLIKLIKSEILLSLIVINHNLMIWWK